MFAKLITTLCKGSQLFPSLKNLPVNDTSPPVNYNTMLTAMHHHVVNASYVSAHGHGTFYCELTHRDLYAHADHFTGEVNTKHMYLCCAEMTLAVLLLDSLSDHESETEFLIREIQVKKNLCFGLIAIYNIEIFMVNSIRR